MLTEPELAPNLWTCPECGKVLDIGNDDLSCTEDVVRLRLVHDCRAPHISLVKEFGEGWLGDVYGRFRVECQTCPWSRIAVTEERAYRDADDHYDHAAELSEIKSKLNASVSVAHDLDWRALGDDELRQRLRQSRFRPGWGIVDLLVEYRTDPRHARGITALLGPPAEPA